MLGGVGADGVGLIGPQGPVGIGSQGPQGATGENGTYSSSFPYSMACGVSGTDACKVGALGPGGGWIFFVDYNDQYPGFTLPLKLPLVSMLLDQFRIGF